MKKRIILTLTFMLMFLPGCIIPNKEIRTEQPKVCVWWGTTQEIKDFLDSPQAQSERWIIESIGG